MAEGFAQGFASGFGLVGDVFKEQRREEAQARAEKFQREEFTERKRLNELAAAEREKDRATRASEFATTEARLTKAEERLARAQEDQSEYNRANLELRRREYADQAAARAADLRRDRMRDALTFGDVPSILADKTLGPQLMSALDPGTRGALEALNSGRLNLDSLDNKTLNLILGPEVRRNIGETRRVLMNPNEADPAKREYRTVKVTNKSISSVSVDPRSKGNSINLNLLVEGVDQSGKKVIFKQPMTTGRSIGDQDQDPKSIDVRQGVDYLVLGKRALYNTIVNTPAFRNAASRYGVGMSPSDEREIYDKSVDAHRQTYKDYLDYFTSMRETNSGRFEELYGDKTSPAELAKELTARQYGGLDANAYASSRISSLRGGADSALAASMPDLDAEAERYRSMGINIAGENDAINMKNIDLRIQSSVGGSDATSLISYMSRALSGARGRPISPGELADLETEVSRVANSQRVNFSGDDAASKFVGVVNTAVNNLTRTKEESQSEARDRFRREAGIGMAAK